VEGAILLESYTTFFGLTMEFKGTLSKEKWASHAGSGDEYLCTLPKFIVIINLALYLCLSRCISP
jgi:hypothetical protein